MEHREEPNEDRGGVGRARDEVAHEDLERGVAVGDVLALEPAQPGALPRLGRVDEPVELLGRGAEGAPRDAGGLAVGAVREGADGVELVAEQPEEHELQVGQVREPALQARHLREAHVGPVEHQAGRHVGDGDEVGHVLRGGDVRGLEKRERDVFSFFFKERGKNT